MLKRWYTLAFAAGAMGVSLAAVVQAEVTVSRTGADAMIEEVVVTARRREEGLQSAPSRFPPIRVIRWITGVLPGWIRLRICLC